MFFEIARRIELLRKIFKMAAQYMKMKLSIN